MADAMEDMDTTVATTTIIDTITTTDHRSIPEEPAIRRGIPRIACARIG